MRNVNSNVDICRFMSNRDFCTLREAVLTCRLDRSYFLFLSLASFHIASLIPIRKASAQYIPQSLIICKASGICRWYTRSQRRCCKLENL